MLNELNAEQKKRYNQKVRAEKKPTENEIEVFNYITELLISGYSRRECRRELITKYNYNDNDARRILNKAIDYYAAQDKEERDRMIAILVGRYDEIYAAASTDKEYTAAINALKELGKLFGVSDQKFDINLNNNYTFDFGTSVDA